MSLPKESANDMEIIPSELFLQWLELQLFSPSLGAKSL
jgi:hypothetical protein